MRSVRVLIVALVILVASLPPVSAAAKHPEPARPSHVVLIGMDNYHLEDIEAQMPILWAFLHKGAFAANTHHPVLPTRTAPDFSSMLSGQYPDRHGVISNSFLAPGSRSGFSYWEDVAGRTPPTYLSSPPWRLFTEAGLDVGAIGMNGLVLEGADEVKAHLGLDRSPTQRELDLYLGVAVHHADGTDSLGTAEIPAIATEFPDGWVNGWAGPPHKHADITLRMTTDLLAAGVPVVFTYMENVHGRCTPTGCAGDQLRGSFDDLLQADDAAFGRFLSDLANLGLTTDNTLFVITTDEGDHYLPNFATSIPTADLPGPATLGSGALFYSPDADALALGLRDRAGVQYVATRTAIRALHIAGGADARTPTFIAFADEDHTFSRPPAARWNHGNINPDVTDIWLGLAGPGIRPGGLDAYTDQADLVPTILALLGLDGSPHIDGVPITPALAGFDDDGLLSLREAYKQITAPLGSFGRAMLDISTTGVFGTPDDRAAADARIADLAVRRDSLAGRVRQVLDESDPDDGHVRKLLRAARELIAEAGG
jgi:hypothetical protein